VITGILGGGMTLICTNMSYAWCYAIDMLF